MCDQHYFGNFLSPAPLQVTCSVVTTRWLTVATMAATRHQNNTSSEVRWSVALVMARSESQEDAESIAATLQNFKG